jgi:hypothetical protein
MPRRASFTDSSLSWKERLKLLLTGKSTWLSIIYMVLMLPIGIVYFTVMITLIAVSLVFLMSPITTIVFNVPLVTLGHTVYHLPAWMTLLTAAFGVGLATATMHVARWTGAVHGKFAKALLVSD